MKLVIKIAAIVVVLIVQIIVAYFLVNWLIDKQLDAPAAFDSPLTGELTAEQEAAKDYEYGALFQLSDLIVNPQGSTGRRIFKISLALEYDPENVVLAEELAARVPFMRDHLISYLGSMDESQLSNISFRETIRDSLGSTLNSFLKEGTVDRVLFQDFIRQ